MMEGKQYRDPATGRKYRVMGGIGPMNYKARWQEASKRGESGWKGCVWAPRRETFQEAQADLDQRAKERSWQAWREEDEEP